MTLFLFNFHNADHLMQMSSFNLDISEEDNKLRSVLSLMLHNSFTVAASDILFIELNFISNFFKRIAISFVLSELLIYYYYFLSNSSMTYRLMSVALKL